MTNNVQQVLLEQEANNLLAENGFSFDGMDNTKEHDIQMKFEKNSIFLDEELVL